MPTDRPRISDEELRREAERIEACGWHPDHSQSRIASALRELSALRTREAGWQTMDTAPKGTPSRYGSGPHILGAIRRDWGVVHQIVSYQYHKNGKTGSWKGHHGVWEPDFWMPLPALSQPTGEGSA